MKLSDAIKNIDKSSSNDTSICIGSLAEALDIFNDVSWSEEFTQQVVGYYLQKWYCTDTEVGVVAYFFNGEFAFLTKQEGRKCPIEFFFASEEIADKLRKYILSLNGEEKKRTIELIELDEDIPDFYNVDFTGQLMATQGFYNGKSCTVDDEQDSNTISQQLNVTYRDGSKEVINIREFKIPHHVNK